jgi:bacterioferritin
MTPDATPIPGPFVLDMQAIRARARAEMRKGPVTDAYGHDLDRVIEVLNEALATEIVCTLRYRAHAWACAGIHAEVASAEFNEHARQEWEHMLKLGARISQLGGTPDLNPATLSERSHATFSTSDDLREMVEEDLVAERIAVHTYQEIIQWLGNGDPTTRTLLESILEQEEEHADDMLDLLNTWAEDATAAAAR